MLQLGVMGVGGGALAPEELCGGGEVGRSSGCEGCSSVSDSEDSSSQESATGFFLGFFAAVFLGGSRLSLEREEDTSSFLDEGAIAMSERADQMLIFKQVRLVDEEVPESS